MNKVIILNSAVMPQEGIYVLKKITKGKFCEELKYAYDFGILRNYIGYQQNIDFIKQWTGVELILSREETKIDDGDVMLIMKLKYRVKDPSTKGQPVSEEDYEFYMCYYSKEK